MDEATTDALAELEFLAASPNRYRLLSALATGPTSPDDLGDRLELPRTTLHRNLSALADRGYVAHRPAEKRYAVTPAGELALEALDRATSTVASASSLAPFLERFPADLPVDPAELAAGTVTIATTESPYDPVSTVRNVVGLAERVRAFLPTINPLYLESLRKYDPEDLTIEAVATPSAYEAVASDYADLLDRLRASPTVSLLTTEAVPQYALAVADDTLLVGAYDDNMRTHSVLRTAADSAVGQWAEERYEAVRADATVLE